MKILFACLAYFVGAIPTGYIFFFLSEKKDIRGFGSRSTGATNVLRLKGWHHAVPVMLLDILKGFLPPFLAIEMLGDFNLALLCAFLAVVGHCYPVFIRFRGGKGVATSVGAYLGVAPAPLLPALIIFVAVVAVTRYVSLGSLTSSLSLPLFALALGTPRETVLFGFCLFVLISIRHRGNIKRLIAGSERKIGARSR